MSSFVDTLPRNSRTQVLREVFAAASVGISISDEAGRILDVNPAYLRIYGWPREELVGQNFTKVVPPEKRAEALAQHRRFLASDAAEESFEATIRSKDGRQVDVVVTMIRAEGAGGQRYKIAIITDVTRFKHLEAALREREARLDEIVRTVPGVLYQWNVRADGTSGLTWISPKSDEMLGIPPDTLLSEPATLRIHPDDWEAWRTSLKLSAATQTDWNCEGRRVLPDGSVQWLQGLSKPTLQLDGSTLYTGILLDITERKTIEQRSLILQQGVDAAKNGILIADALAEDMPIVYVNPAFERITGHARDEIVGRNCRILQGDDIDQPGLDTLRAALRADRGCDVTLRNYRKDGTIFWNNLSIAPIRDAAGRTTHFVGMVADVTQWIRLGLLREIQASATRLLRVDLSFEEAVDQFLSASLRAIDWDYAALWLREGSAPQLRRVAVTHRADAGLECFAATSTMRSLKPKTSLVAAAIESGEVVWSNDFTEEKDRKLVRALVEAGIRTACIIPVVSEGKVIGAVETLSKRRNPAEAMLTDSAAVLGAQIGDLVRRREIEAERRLADVAFETSEAIIVTDPRGIIQRVNDAFCRLTGYPAREILGKSTKVMRSGLHRPEDYDAVWKTLSETGRWQGEMWKRRKSGEVYLERLAIRAVQDERGEITHLVGIFHDVTEQRSAEEEIHRLAFYDPLTNLPNRRLLGDRLTQAIATAQRRRHFGAVLFLDLDNFKTLNDARGHDAGDDLLRQVARRLVDGLRQEDTVARFAGDEFVILLNNIGATEMDALEHALQVAEKLRGTVARPYRVGDIEHEISLSIGVTTFPKDGKTSNDLLKEADTAMFRAKENGRNAVAAFEPSMEIAAKRRLELQSDLREALRQKQFRTYLEPQLGLDGDIRSAHMVLRWHHPSRGVLSPPDFVKVAEETGVMVEIGEWLLAQAMTTSARLRRAHPGFRLSVNVGAQHFAMPSFVDSIDRLVTASETAPSDLVLEIDEGPLLAKIDTSEQRLRLLRDAGFSICIDDFGSGYSSVATLKRLPIDQIKIQDVFVHEAVDDASGAAMVEAVIAIANILGIEVVAEGVETEAQFAFLRSAGCKVFQGALVGRPMSVERFVKAYLGDTAPLTRPSDDAP